MRLLIALVAVGLSMGGCVSGRSWADTKCLEPESKRTAEQQLDAVVVRTLAARTAGGLRGQILAACHQCKEHHSNATMPKEDHCRYVNTALYFARTDKWKECLSNLLHERQAPPLPSSRERASARPPENENPNWLDHECFPGETARFILDEIELKVKQPYPYGPLDPAVRDSVLQEIRDCRNHPRDEDDPEHPSQGARTYQTAAQHCALIDEAYFQGSIGNWDQCYTELDHMLGGGTDETTRTKK